MSLLLVEQTVGRQLTDAEKAIDVVKLDRALAAAKDQLNAAIHDEMLRATLVWISNGGSPRLAVTPDMRAVLDSLYQLGATEAWLELDRLGYDLQGRRAYIEEGPAGGDVPDYLSRNLRGIGIRLEDELVAVDLAGASHAAVAKAIMQVPGARDLASRAISTAMIGGFASTFDQVQDIVGGWQYTAVLDGGTCDECEPLDGTIYETLEQLFVVLPNYGPNPLCLGGGRCRCRAVPLPTDPSSESPTQPEPPPLSPFEEALKLPTRSLHADVFAEVTAARAAIASLHKMPSAAIDDGPLKVRIVSNRAAGQYRYRTDETETPVDLLIDPLSSSPGLTLAHEVGHWIDHKAFAAGAGFATETGAAEVAEWWAAVSDTTPIRRLRAWLANPEIVDHVLPDGTLQPFVPARSRLKYLLEPVEIFARSYSQWVAVRTGDQSLLSGLEKKRRGRYPEQWNDLEFEEIAAAFDTIARNQGWQR